MANQYFFNVGRMTSSLLENVQIYLSRHMRFPTMWYVRPAKPQISLIRVFASFFKYSVSVKLLTELYLEFLSLKGGCKGSSESTLVKIPHC